MILSASGWRKVFVASGDEQDKSSEISDNDKILSFVAAEVFFDYISGLTHQPNPVIALGMDTRPTGAEIADAMIHALSYKGAIIQFSGITSAPEIMAYAKNLDGFVYISASHNPVGHNGIKFGTNDGGVLNGTENAKLIKDFLERIKDESKIEEEVSRAYTGSSSMIKSVYDTAGSAKHNSLKAYKDFVIRTIADSEDKDKQDSFFKILMNGMEEKKVGIVCDFNGSSRAKCIDREFFKENKINFYSINDDEIVHEIIPEAENLVHVAAEMERLHKQGHDEVVLGYMPDCDGDRGNIVYWDDKTKKAVILKAQEVFSLSVLAELTFSIWQHGNEPGFNPAVAVNCPTSMRIEELAGKLGCKVFRAEVGEANVVNLAREKRAEKYTVRILGEGSNGGTITYPASVRDPLNTIFAILKLLLIRENGLFYIWCKKAGIPYNPDFTLSDIMDTIPKYTTTGVSEPRAVLKVQTTDHAVLKKNFQKNFETLWNKGEFPKKYSFTSYKAIITNGTKEQIGISDYSLSGKGGLKILFYKGNEPAAFIWMRGSGTEPVFRIMCDVKGNSEKDILTEKELLQIETDLIRLSDK